MAGQPGEEERAACARQIEAHAAAIQARQERSFFAVQLRARLLLLHKKIKNESLRDRALREERPLDKSGLRLPPDEIETISEPFGNSVHQFRSA